MTSPTPPGGASENVPSNEALPGNPQTGTTMSLPDPAAGLAGEMAALAAECRNLSDKQELLTRELQAKKKDSWDRLGLSGPLFIGAIGLLLTLVLHADSTRRADIAREANERAQDLQSFNIFLPYLISSDSIGTDSVGQAHLARDSVRQEFAIRALRQLGSCRVAVLAASLHPTPGTKAGLEGLLELKRPGEITKRDDCGFADTVYQRVFLDTTATGLEPQLDPNSLPEGVSPPETIRVPLFQVDTTAPLTDRTRRMLPSTVP